MQRNARISVLLAVLSAASAFQVPSVGLRLSISASRACIGGVPRRAAALRMAADFDDGEEVKPKEALKVEPVKEGSQKFDLKSRVDKSGEGGTTCNSLLLPSICLSFPPPLSPSPPCLLFPHSTSAHPSSPAAPPPHVSS